MGKSVPGKPHTLSLEEAAPGQQWGLDVSAGQQGPQLVPGSRKQEHPHPGLGPMSNGVAHLKRSRSLGL